MQKLILEMYVGLLFYLMAVLIQKLVLGMDVLRELNKQD